MSFVYRRSKVSWKDPPNDGLCYSSIVWSIPLGSYTLLHWLYSIRLDHRIKSVDEYQAKPNQSLRCPPKRSHDLPKEGSGDLRYFLEAMEQSSIGSSHGHFRTG